MMNTLTRVAAIFPPSVRSQVKSLIARFRDVGHQSFYSQWGEDAFLHAYFREKFLANNPESVPHLFAQPDLVGTGYYIDIGAYAPKMYSNSYWFYQHGWSGINVDGAPKSMNAFDQVRPRDKNIEAVLSDEENEVIFYHWESPHLVNTLSTEMAERWSAGLGRPPTKLKINSKRLDRLLNEFHPADQEISFMSVDVEGHDLQVLRSNNWEKYRPELVLAEDHLLLSEKVSGSPITQFMESVGYSWCAWVGPTIVYRDQSKRDFRFSLEKSG